jgi:hypothetical protein
VSGEVTFGVTVIMIVLLYSLVMTAMFQREVVVIGDTGQMHKTCGYCGNEADHEHKGRGGWACGTCCSFHGMLTFPEVEDGLYEWVGEMFAYNVRLMKEIANLKEENNNLSWKIVGDR